VFARIARSRKKRRYSTVIDQAIRKSGEFTASRLLGTPPVSRRIRSRHRRAPILSKIKFTREAGMAKDDPSDLGTGSEAIGSLDMQEICRDFAYAPSAAKLAVLANLTTLIPQEKGPIELIGSNLRVPFEVVQLDYTQTGEQIKMLTDIRFKLLAFVPPIVGAGVTLLSSKAASTAGDHILIGSIGVLGFLLTLGIVLYDFRNSQLYNAQIHRAKVLERVLGCIKSGNEKLWPVPSIGGGKAYGTPGSHGLTATGGVHNQRAIALGSILGQRIAHGPALSLVYAVALGAWVFPIVRDLGAGFWMTITDFQLTRGNGLATSVTALLAAAVSATYFRRRMNAEDRGWPVTHLGYDKPEEPSWAKGYEDKIAQEEIKRREQANRRWRFEVVGQDKLWLGGIRLRIRSLMRDLKIIGRDNNLTTIVETDRKRRKLVDRYYRKLEITETDFLIGCDQGKVVIKERIPYDDFNKAAEITESNMRSTIHQKIDHEVALKIATEIGVDKKRRDEYFKNGFEYYLYRGGAIEIGSQL
jgi:hypothetical protein